MAGAGPREGRVAARVEWTAAAISAAAVAALVGVLVAEALGQAEALPDLRVTLAPALALPDGRAHLRWTVANHGGQAATSVGLALRLRSDGRILERRQVTVDYVPAHSEVKGGFFLDRPPGAGAALDAVVEGYVDP